MPWNNKSECHQRYDLIQQIRARKVPVAQLCLRWNISRKTAYKWLGRYLKKGRRGLQNRPPVARKHPQKLPRKWQRRARQLRLKHRSWGPRKLHHRLQRLYGSNGVPSPATLGRWLRGWQMVGTRRRRTPSGPVLWQQAMIPARRPNDVWTADFKGWFRLGDGSRAEPLTVRDLASRYVLAVQLMAQQDVQTALPVFKALFGRYGLPKAIRVDNGSPFGSKGPGGLTRLSAWWTKLGIEVQFIRAGHPEDNGAHEQFHRVLKAETASPPAKTWRGQQRKTQRWVEQYNEHRPHEALLMKAPAEVYSCSAQKINQDNARLSYPRSWPSRAVKTNGMISWRGRARSVGEAFARERVGLKPKGTGVWHVYFGPLLIGELREADATGMRPAVYQRSPK